MNSRKIIEEDERKEDDEEVETRMPKVRMFIKFL
jgi:hypothetical protein